MLRDFLAKIDFNSTFSKLVLTVWKSYNLKAKRIRLGNGQIHPCLS